MGDLHGSSMNSALIMQTKKLDCTADHLSMVVRTRLTVDLPFTLRSIRLQE